MTRKYPIGTGPFKFKAWKKYKISLEENPDYFEKDKKWKKLPYLEAIAIAWV